MEENLYKIFFATLFFPFLSFWLWKFFLTGMRKESFYTLKEGVFAAWLFRLLLTAGVACIILYLFRSNLIRCFRVDLPTWLRLAGLPLGICIFALIIWTFHSLDNNYFASLNLRKDHELITTGLYSRVRHPLYLLFALLWICYFLLSANLAIGIPGIAAYLVIYLFRIPREEKMLADHFGEKYEQYREKTGMLLPRF